MVDVLTEIIIDRPKKEVSEFVSNPDNATQWYVNIKSADWQTPGPLQIGSRVAFTAQFLGKKLSYIYKLN